MEKKYLKEKLQPMFRAPKEFIETQKKKKKN